MTRVKNAGDGRIYEFKCPNCGLGAMLEETCETTMRWKYDEIHMNEAGLVTAEPYDSITDTPDNTDYTYCCSGCDYEVPDVVCMDELAEFIVSQGNIVTEEE